MRPISVHHLDKVYIEGPGTGRKGESAVSTSRRGSTCHGNTRKLRAALFHAATAKIQFSRTCPWHCASSNATTWSANEKASSPIPASNLSFTDSFSFFEFNPRQLGYYLPKLCLRWITNETLFSCSFWVSFESYIPWKNFERVGGSANMMIFIIAFIGELIFLFALTEMINLTKIRYGCLGNFSMLYYLG